MYHLYDLPQIKLAPSRSYSFIPGSLHLLRGSEPEAIEQQ